MRALTVAPLLAPMAALAQRGTPVSERQLARVGVAFGPSEASGLSVLAPSVGYGARCYGYTTTAYYECGSTAVAFLVDGEYEVDLFSSHTVFLAPWSSVDPFLTGFAGVGYGDEAGLVYGWEAGVNLWLTAQGGLTVYAGRVVGERQRYVRLGVGLVFDMGD